MIKLYDDDYVIKDLIELIKNKTLVIHNALFDLEFLYKHNFYPTDIKDTMLASKIIYNGDYFNMQHDFKSCMKRELNIEYDKTEQKNISTVKLSQSSTISYSFNDVDKLLELHDKLENSIIKNNQTATYNLHCKFIRALAYIERCGLPISVKKWKNKIKEDLRLSLKYEKDIIKYIYKNIPEFRQNQLDLFDNKETVKVLLTSPLQMLKVFNKLNINTKDKDNKDSINEAVISKTKHEFVDLWLKFQESKHRVTTFGENILSQVENDRLYTNFNPMVDTARLSTRKGYINFLNFPGDLNTRNCFEVREGNKLIVCDFSGQETILAADLSNDEAMVDSVVHGKDLHCAFARVLYPEIKDLDDEDIMKNHKDKRNAAKVPRFALN